MRSLERLLAIRAQLNKPTGTAPLKISTGEEIISWSLVDERGTPVTEQELDDEMLEQAYARHVDWECPEEFK